MKWSGHWGKLWIVVCDEHRETYKEKLTGVRRTKEGYSCFFCRQPKRPFT